MKFFLISDNNDTKNGMRIAGIKGVAVSGRQELIEAVETVLADESIGVLLITHRLVRLCPDYIYGLKLSRRRPLITEIPDRHGEGGFGDSLRAYLKEAIGIEI